MIPGFLVTFVINALVLIYGYKTFKAIESTPEPGKPGEKEHWLTFWCLFSGITFAEFWTDTFIFWFPFYYELKLGMFLYLGFFKGAGFIYRSFIRGFLKSHESLIDKKLADSQKIAAYYKKEAEKLAKQKAAEYKK